VVLLTFIVMQFEITTLEHYLYLIGVTSCHTGFYISIYFDVVGKQKAI